jgi:hypothetical protein
MKIAITYGGMEWQRAGTFPEITTCFRGAKHVEGGS